MIFAFALSSMVVTAACGSDDDDLNDLEVENEEPTIEIDPIRYDFSASVAPGDEEEGVITFINVGAETLEISNVEFNSLGDDVFFPGQNFPSGTITLDSLETHEFSVWYRPHDEEEHSNTINFSSNDPDRLSGIIPLASEAYSP